MNNKKIGTEFEQEICKMLKEQGWWVHFIEPKPDGSQPFDIIAVRQGRAVAIDCKTCASEAFNISRLEDNQIFAFERWIACGNDMPKVIIKHNDDIYIVPYDYIKEKTTIKLKEIPWAKWGVLPV